MKNMLNLIHSYKITYVDPAHKESQKEVTIRAMDKESAIKRHQTEYKRRLYRECEIISCEKVKN